MTKRIWTYFGTVIKVHDGDTFTVDLDLGLYMWRKAIPVRIAGINAPELANPDKSGVASQVWLANLLPLGLEVRLDSVDGKFYEKYGRLLATPYLPNGIDIARASIAAGMSVPFMVS